MDTKDISQKLTAGFISLTARRAALLLISFLTINVILARILPVYMIGIFDIANSILAFFAFFSDIGLAGALIQKRDISTEDLSTTFTIQEILAVIISTVVVLAAPTLANFYHLDPAAVNLIRALGLAFFLTSLKVIPSILLERELRFNPLVVVEIAEAITFNGLLIFLSINRFGIDSFTYAVLLRGGVGLVLIFIISPWKLRLGFQKASAKQLLNFGVPFQINSLLALLKDKLVPLVIARMVGPVGVGYITWSQNLAFMPLEVMNIMTRITFPAFARLQDDQEMLKDTLEKSIFFTSLFFYPLLFGLLAIAPSLVTYIVSAKWQSALPLIYLFALGAFWATLSSPFTNFLNAIGKIRITLYLMVMWTALEWLLSPLLTYFYGFYGVAIASALISFSSIIPIIIIKRIIDVRIIKNIYQPLVVAMVMAALAYIASNILVRNVLSLFLVIITSGVFYFGVMSAISWKKIAPYLSKFR